MSSFAKRLLGRAAAVTLSALMISSALPVQAMAAGVSDPDKVSFYESVTGQYPEAMAALRQGLLNCSSTISLENCLVKDNDLRSVFSAVLAKTPELFYVDKQYSYYQKTVGGVTYVSKVVPEYTITDRTQINTMLQAFYDEADFYLNQVSGDLTKCDDDFSKAALLHDEIVLDAHYETQNTSSYTFMVNKYGLCESYSRVYAYLLGQVGISSEIVDSDGIKHEWMKACIDGSYYNVDVTWDDPVNDAPGLVRHNHFLLSDSHRTADIDDYISRYGYYESDYAPDYYYTNFPSGTEYDNHKFHDYNSKMIKLACKKEVYAIDFDNYKLVRYNYSTDTATTLYTINDRWYVSGGGGYYTGAYSGLEEYNGLLYFNTQSAVYSFDPATGQTQKIGNNPGSSGKTLYGLRLRGRELYGVVTTDPNTTGTEILITVFPEAHTHTYGAPAWNWSNDHSTATAVFTCTAGDSTVSEVAEVSTETTPATCTEAGSKKYTATVQFGGKTYTNKYTEQIAASGHQSIHYAAAEATEKRAGNIEYWYCPVCGKYFSDSGMKNEITKEQTVIPKLLANKSTVSASEINVNESITITGAATGGTGPYTFAYYYKLASKNTWTAISNGYVSNTSVNKTFTAGGAYNVKVIVKDSSGKTVQNKIDLTVTDLSLKNNSYLSSESVLKGKTVTITGDASGGKGPYKFSYYYRRASKNTWRLLSDGYTDAESVELTLGSPDDYVVRVIVKDSAGTAKSRYLYFTVREPSLFEAGISVSPENLGTGGYVTITGIANGGSEEYDYVFYYKPSRKSSWTKLGTGTGASASVTRTITVAGDYDARVIVSDGSGYKYDLKDTFTVTEATDLVNESSISADNVSPGTAVRIYGDASGGTGIYSYTFFYKRAEKNSYNTLSPSGSSDTGAVLRLNSAGTYDIRVIAKDNTGRTAAKEFELTVK